MNCHSWRVSLTWDGVSQIVVCEICSAYRFVDTPDETANRIVSLTHPGSSSCPRCRRRMTEAAMEGLKIEYCPICRGALLTEDLFAMLVRNRRPEFREAAQGKLVLPADQLGSRIHCPDCRLLMHVHPCFGPNNLIIETCVDCQLVWLDCSETSRTCQSDDTKSVEVTWYQSAKDSALALQVAHLE